METLHQLVGPAMGAVVLIISAILLIVLNMKAIKPCDHQTQATASGDSNFAETRIQVTTSSRMDAIPEDSVLRRHFLTEQVAQKVALANPIPTDSILRRHYDAIHLQSQRNEESLTSDLTESANRVSTIEQSIGKLEQAFASGQKAGFVQSAEGKIDPWPQHLKIPEDSVLKRHFIQQLLNETQTGFSVRPSDSVLRRHYDHLIGVELDRRLAG